VNVLLLALAVLGAELYRPPSGNYPVTTEPQNVWVFFTDKGFTNPEQVDRLTARTAGQLDALAVERRLLNMGQAWDFDDLPPYERYVSRIEDMGGELRTRSAWLNAASFRMAPEIIAQVARLSFVYQIQIVGARWEPTGEQYYPLAPEDSTKPHRGEDTTGYKDIYGLAYAQNRMLGVPQVQATWGVNGSGVRLGLLDTGLKRRHPAVKGINVIAEHDFLSGDRFMMARDDDTLTTRQLDNLQGIGLIEEPVLFTNGDTVYLCYVADSAQGAIPIRALFGVVSFDGGLTWGPRQTLYTGSPDIPSLHRPTICGKAGYAYVCWEVTPKAENDPYIWQGYFRNGVWQGAQAHTLQYGRSPNLAASSLVSHADSLYLVSCVDSMVWFNSASIAGGTPVWGAGEAKIPPSGYPFPELVKLPCVARDDAGNILVTVTGWRTGRVYLYHSSDGGSSFEELAAPVLANAEKAQLRFADCRFHLLYKEHKKPIVNLIYQSSTDGQLWSRSAVCESLLGIGGFDLRTGNELAASSLKIVFETEGRLLVRKSPDGGASWTSSGILRTADYANNPGWLDETRVLWFEKGDTNTDVEPGDSLRFGSNQADHGTRMASIIGGYRRGSMVGVAPGVEFLIAKTEFHSFRNPTIGYELLIEEDNYIAGLEWAERHGASIISSSLGYTGWYQPEDFDGRTAPISVAVGRAAERGVLVVSAMGNRDSTRNPWPEPYIVAPADAYNIITVGGIEKDSSPWHTPGGGGTGCGPTPDGRRKPDLVAMGDSVTVVAPDSSSNVYEGSSGTSGATALVAGCCALLLEAHPEWKVWQVRETLFKYAARPEVMDSAWRDTFGWGIPNVYTILKANPPEIAPLRQDDLGDPFPNPFSPGRPSDSVYCPILLTQPTSFATLSIFTLAGELVDTITVKGTRKAGSEKFLTAPGRYTDKAYLARIGACWDGRNEQGRPAASGLYYVALQTGNGRAVKKFALVR
jgi:hypothetical protein